jgi:peptidoglycan DL-endopeptidase LytE
MQKRRDTQMKLTTKIGSLALALSLVPTIASAQYIVKPNDTLSKIAVKHNMSLKDILSLNPQFDNPNQIHIGDHVVIRSKDIASDIVDYARSLQDKTVYQYGGQQIDSIPLYTDCSGWVQHIYGKFGIDLPRVSRDQSKVGKPIKFQDMRKGDLMFFSTRSDKVITHVGIYISDNFWISNLSTKQDVTILSSWGSWTQKHFLWAQRVI